jgi:hypothetical protein
MFTVLFRSACVGIAAAVAGLFVSLPILGYFSFRTVTSTGDVEAGWDLVALASARPVAFVVVPLVPFAVGFAIGFRYFSKSLPSK